MIGNEVRRRREGLGLSGAQLAMRAGMSPSAVSQIETGKRTPSSTSVIKLAAALGIEAGDLYPKGQPPLPFDGSVEVVQARAPGGPYTLEEAREFLAREAGSEWLALPDDEWPLWWRQGSIDEVAQRLAQLNAEYRVLIPEVMAAKSRGRGVFDVFTKVFARHMDAQRYAPALGNELESGEDAESFQRRQQMGEPRSKYELSQYSKEAAQNAAMVLEAS